MNILFTNKKVERQFCSKYKSSWRYPDQVKTKLEGAENYIRNSDSLMDIANYPPFRFERLEGKRKNEWSIRLGNTGYRVTMIPCDEKEQEIKDAEKLKAARRSALLDSIRKMIRRCIDSEIRKHPDFRLTEKEAAEMLKEISDRLKTELDKLTEKGTN